MKHIIFLSLTVLLLSSCGILEKRKPLRERLQGEWLVLKDTSTWFDSLGKVTTYNPYVHDSTGRHHIIYTFKDTIVDVKTLLQPSAFPYELKEDGGKDSLLAYTFTRNHPAHRIGISFPSEDRMLWHCRAFDCVPKSHEDLEYTMEFKRVKLQEQ
ncbi:hypothetical protein CLV24_11453 [Pontibacter ummariensis]|uniref:Uncharacterized protein n=1 Tax=Pontibacter ummariensis TaxID=1610492 RepID=A0A239HLP7_9BACT|nr:hypothetical protein [Pontibacter ummariensis]PRY10325.1 hypothetical protein CLV24_11453 [Pontibacter ummariensis]SNS82270.1 hypothetical protein SAMN06296052_11453 [Pontibacter ummariensis]